VCFFAGSTEVGILFFLSLFLPLYLRIRRERTLDHFIRGRIYQLLREKPGGYHYSEIKKLLALTNGVLAYHLYVLELQGYVRSYRVGTRRFFYATEMPPPEQLLDGKYAGLSALQQEMLKTLKNKGALTQKELCKILNKSQQVISYNLKVLIANDFVREIKEGHTKKYIAK